MRASLLSRIVPAVVSLVVALAALPANGANDPDWVDEVPSKSQTQVETKEGKTVLKLGIEHSSRLAPIPDFLQAGSIFDSKLLEGGNDKLIWYRIPNWLAGQWQRTRETRVFSHDYASGYVDNSQSTFMSEQIADFGVQKDREGNIWNCNLKPKAVSDHGSYFSVALMQAKEPVRSTNKEIIFREVYTVLDVQKESKLITDSYLMESLTRHRPLPDGNLETNMSFEVYNAGGTPRSVQENVSQDQRKGPPDLIDNYKGRNLKAEFAEFLRNNNLGNLVP
jgi:hypothetical protein